MQDKFRTELTPPTSSEKIGLDTPILTVGSCFAHVIGDRLVEHKFQASSNPFGVIYNPISIFKLLELAVDRHYPPPDSYGNLDQVHFNYFLHSSLSDLDPKALETKVKKKIDHIHELMADCKWLILSLGTAWVFERKDNQQIVANCHKVPAQNFNKRLLSRKAILDRFEATLHKLEGYNPGINIVLTVSPVRHLRDTLELNQVSKATLRLACHTLQEAHHQVQYFPSYEIVLDDLRDYRFFKSDLIHPSDQAEDYIWEKFCRSYLDNQALEFLTVWKNLRKAIQHKPFHQSTTKHQQFLRTTLARLEALDFPVDVKDEIMHIKKQLR